MEKAKEFLCEHCYCAIRSRGEKLRGFWEWADDVTDGEAESVDCCWCGEEAFGRVFVWGCDDGNE